VGRDISTDYNLFLEAIAGLMVIDKNGNLVYINDQCADYIKVDREKSIGKYITNVFPPSNMQNLLKGKNKYNTNFYFTDGRMSISTQVQLLPPKRQFISFTSFAVVTIHTMRRSK